MKYILILILILIGEALQVWGRRLGFAMSGDKHYNENDEMLVSVGENREKWGVGETRVDNFLKKSPLN